MQIADIETAIRHSRLVLEMAQRAFWEGEQDHDAKEELSAAVMLAADRLRGVEDALERTAGPAGAMLAVDNTAST